MLGTFSPVGGSGSSTMHPDKVSYTWAWGPGTPPAQVAILKIEVWMTPTFIASVRLMCALDMLGRLASCQDVCTKNEAVDCTVVLVPGSY